MGKDKHTFKKIEENKTAEMAFRHQFLNCCTLAEELKKALQNLELKALPFCETPRAGLTGNYKPYLYFTEPFEDEAYNVSNAAEFFNILKTARFFYEEKQKGGDYED